LATEVPVKFLPVNCELAIKRYIVEREPGRQSFHRSPMKEEALSLRQKYLSILTQLAPAGAVGVSLALGAAAPATASTPPAQAPAASTGAVADRLAAVRAAISEMDGDKATNAEDRVAWWGNGWGGWGWPNFRNFWHNWGNYFRNW
jgi:hypothetical protein